MPHRSNRSTYAARMPLLPVIALMFLAFLSGAVPAWALGDTDDDADSKEKAVAEFDWKLPAPPQAANLLEFYTSRATGQSFSVDAKSLTVDSDGIVRYTMVAVSPSGAQNVSYEGIRCKTMEKRSYAFGQADGSWVRARVSEWKHFSGIGVNIQHAALTDYICREGSPAGKVDGIINTIRYKH